MSHETNTSVLMGYITTSPILGAQEPPYGHRTGYDPKALGEVPLPHDWQDPNFNHRGGRAAVEQTRTGMGKIIEGVYDVTGAVG